ncbi:MAG: succinate dehydrogenase, cytochrome b556 subunit [Pseudomonadota bacterium]
MTSADTTPGARRERPLSPHLSVYRPIVTMVMSIMHRITGVMNVAGFVLVVGFLLATASGPEAYATASAIYGSWLGRVILVLFTWSLIHHMLGGVRHAVWDMGRGLGDVRYSMSWATAIGSASLTVLLWVVIMIVEAV